MKWIKFKEEMPPEEHKIWISDGEKVWSSESTIYRAHIMDYYWMNRINPAPPEKEYHDCYRESNAGIFYCYETNDGELVLEHDIGILGVKYCPHCGYSQEKK